MNPIRTLALALAAAALCSGCLIDRGYATSKSGGDGTVLLCHKGKKTMELPASAADAHFGHGDHRGPC